MTEAEKMVERLRRDHDMLNCRVDAGGRRFKTEAERDAEIETSMADCWQAADLIERMALQVETLVGALEPFSDFAGELFARNWNASSVVVALDNPDDSHRVTVGDFFNLRAALALVEKEKTT